LPDHVGSSFARECIETFYKLSNYIFSGDALMDIRKRLSTDNFGQGIIPVKHIRSCTVYFTEVLYSRYQLESSEPQYAKYTRRLVVFLALKQGSAQIDFVIDMCRYGQFRRLYVLVIHLNLLIPLLYRYKEKEFKTKVFVTSLMTEAVEKRWDITFLWDIPLNELTDKVDEWGKTIGRFDRI
jgi:hypothetical protein